MATPELFLHQGIAQQSGALDASASLRLAALLERPRVALYPEGGACARGSLERMDSSGKCLVHLQDRDDFVRVLEARSLSAMAAVPLGVRRKRRGIAPIPCAVVESDPASNVVHVRFTPRQGPAILCGLTAELPAYVQPGVGSSYVELAASVLDIGPFEGVLALHERHPFVHVGALATVMVRLRGSTFQRLCVQFTACEGFDKLWFRVVDRASHEGLALLLAVWAPHFSLHDLGRLGLRGPRSARLVEATVASKAEAMDQALFVRLLGNQAFGRLAGVHEPSALFDPLDPFSVNVVCRLGDKAIGTGRLVLNDGERSRSEIEAEVGLPEWLWQEKFAEVSRFAVHPDYRGAGVMIQLLREVARIALSLGCRYLVLDCIDKLVPIYRRVGAKSLPLSKKHPYSSERVTIMYVDLLKSLTQIDHNLPFWLIAFGPVVVDASESGTIEPYQRRMSSTARLIYSAKLTLSRASRRWVG